MNLVRSAITFHRTHAAWLGEGGQPVAREQAQRRADTCLACPKHDASRPVLEALERAVALAARQQIEHKNALKLRVEGEKSLHLCGVCSCVCRLLVWVPLKHILQTKDEATLDALPPTCWQNVEAKE